MDDKYREHLYPLDAAQVDLLVSSDPTLTGVKPLAAREQKLLNLLEKAEAAESIAELRTVLTQTIVFLYTASSKSDK